MSPSDWKVSTSLLGTGRGQLLIAQERMKHPGQKRNDAQLWMVLVVKGKFDTVKKKKKKIA